MEKLNFQPMAAWDGKFDPYTMAKMRADTFNSTQGSLTLYDCEKCQNRGGFQIPREDGTIFYRECGCMEIRRNLNKAQQSGFGENLRRETFEAYEAGEPWQKQLKQGAMDFAERPEGWFLICGQSGSGKTHLCTAIGRKRLLKGDQVRYLSWRDGVRRLKDYSDPEARETLFKDLKTARILCVDDLFKAGLGPDGSSRPSALEIGITFELINYRYNNRLCTVFSTEKTPQELMQIDEALGGRILEMAKGHTYNIKKDPKRNFRLRHAQEL